MQRLTTREPDASMLECAIVSVNVVLNGFPEGTPKTPEGWGIFRTYDESEPGHVFPAPEAPAEATEAAAETASPAAASADIADANPETQEPRA
jgi:hypothetical protein